MRSLHSPVLGDLPRSITIGDRAVGPGEPCYVVAEAGSNHDGKLETALALVDAAADAGCDAVKFQTFTAATIAAGCDLPETRLPPQFARWGRDLRSLYGACALPDGFHEPLRDRARDRGLHFFSSPFSEAAVSRLARLGVPALKIASFELVHLPLIEAAAATGLPLIISTGMAGLGDVERGLDAAMRAGARQVALLHCGSSYPLEARESNLAAMETLRRAFGLPVGLSDHTLGISVPTAAAALGADVIEKHFTLGRGGDGPDHPFALEPAELKAMVAAVREAQAAVGSPRKRRQPGEEDHARRGRRSLFAARALPAGHVLGPGDLEVLRPGVGIEPLLLERVLGRRLVRAVSAGSPVVWDDVMERGDA